MKSIDKIADKLFINRKLVKVIFILIIILIVLLLLNALVKSQINSSSTSVKVNKNFLSVTELEDKSPELVKTFDKKCKTIIMHENDGEDYEILDKRLFFYKKNELLGIYEVRDEYSTNYVPFICSDVDKTMKKSDVAGCVEEQEEEDLSVDIDSGLVNMETIIDDYNENGRIQEISLKRVGVSD